MAEDFRLGGAYVTITVRDETRSGETRIKERLNKLGATAKVKIDVDSGSFARAERAMDQLAGAQKRHANATGQVRVAEQRLQELRDSGKAKASQIAAAEERVARARRNVEAASTSATRAEQRLAAAGRDAERSVGRIGSASTGLDRANRRGLRLAATMTAIVGAAGAAGTALAALPALGASGLGSIGVLFGAFSGIGDALKAYKQQQESAASTAAQAAATAGSNARAIRDARSSIDDARRNAAQVARDSAEAINEAQEDEARVAEQGARAIEAASERVAGALKDEQRAQEALTQAREDAARELEDLQERVSDYALDQEGAALRVARAEERLKEVQADAEATALDRREAEHDLAVAREAASDLTREQARATTELTEASVKGVDGSDRVRDAQERLTEAHQNTIDAQAELTRTQTEAAQANQEAQKRTARAVRDGAEAQADAARQISDAVQALADTQAQQAEAAAVSAAANGKYERALKDLTPAGRDFVEQLMKMKPLMRGLRDTAQTAFLPGLTDMLKDSEGLFPIFQEHLKRTGEIMGDTARDMGELFKSEEFKANLDALFKASEPITRAIGDTFVRLVDKLVDFGAKMAPASEGFATFLDKLTSGLEGFFDALVPYAEDFQAFWEALGRIVEVLLPGLGTAIGKIAEAMVPILETLADFLEDHADKIDEILIGLAGLYTALKMAGLVKIVAGWTGKIIKLFSALTTSAGGAATAVGSVSTAGAGAGGAAGGAGAAAGGVAGAAGGRGGGIGSKLGRFAKGGVVAVASVVALDKLWEGYNEFVDTVQDDGWLNAMGGALKATINNTMGLLIPDSWKDSAWNWLENTAWPAVQNFGSKVATFFTEMPGKIGGFLQSIPSRVSSIFGTARDWATSRMGELRDWVAERAGAARDWVVERVSTIADSVSSAFGTARDWATTRMTEMRDWVAERAGNVRDWVVERLSPIAERISSVFGTARDWAVDRMGEMRDWVAERAGQVRDGIVGAISGLPNAVANVFGNVRDWALSRLNDLKNLAKEPVQFVVDVVYNNGIRPLWNGIAGTFGLTQLNRIKFATGGMMPGYTPGRDVHQFFSPTGGLLELSGGEPVLRPELGKVLGRNWVDGANAAARSGGVSGAASFIERSGLGSNAFAKGGIFPGVQRFDTGGIFDNLVDGAGRVVGSVSGFVGDMFASGVRGMAGTVRRLFEGVLGDTGRTPGGPSPWRDMLVAIPHRIVDAIVKVATNWMNTSGGGGSGIGGALAFAKAQAGKPYVWGGVGPGGYDCSGFMSALTNIIDGKGPHSRRGATGNFPWAGFQVGRSSPFEIGSSRNTGGGIGHMAGTLAGTNVESRGGDGVVVGPRARGAGDRLFTTRAGKVFDSGGIAQGVGFLPKATIEPERVLSPRETVAFEELVAMLRRDGVGAVDEREIHLHFHDVGLLDGPGARRVVVRLESALNDLARSRR